MKLICTLAATFLGAAAAFAQQGALKPVALRTEYLQNPIGLDERVPRFQWQLESSARSQRQKAWRVVAASTREALEKDAADLWDTGRVEGDAMMQVQYGGTALKSWQPVFWRVQVWDRDGNPSDWSETAQYTTGLLEVEDWAAQWISYKDETPVHADRSKLYLPPARYYRKPFELKKPIARATLFGTALGLVEFEINGKRVGDDYFAPGWADYHQRVHYRAHDVTKLLQEKNVIGATVADGWYAGYVGYGLLVGYGPNKTGRSIYGKTPAFLAQLEVEFEDGTRDRVITDSSWQVSGDGPIREADLLMGEAFDATRVDVNWSTSDGVSSESKWKWENAIAAKDNGSVKAKFYEPGVEREVELGFKEPERLVAYAAPPIRITEELPARAITEPKPGVYIFDLGQNIAGIVRIKLKGSAGSQVQIRYGEKLHPDGRLMTENLRKARATDFYTIRGEADGETWQPRFTYHGFQYVEITGLKEKPAADAVTGLVLNNDTPLTSEFSCSDEVMTQFWKNTVRTQKANFVEVPTDCPQRDERLGWMGDAQIYARTASFNADVSAFFTKWIEDVREAQRDFGAYPDYCPYPFAHGAPGATHGTAWTDAGVIVPHTIWKVYGDQRLIARHWTSMTRFMDWRGKADPELKGVKLGNTWGDWLNVNEDTPIEYIDLCYHGLVARQMSEMAAALEKDEEAGKYRERLAAIRESFAKNWCKPGPNPESLVPKVDTQTAAVLAIACGMFEPHQTGATAAALVTRIEKNGHRMATGFLGTKPLLDVLTTTGHHDLACRLFQSRRFPSWGYEVMQGATSVWERWDSFTKEHGFDGMTGKNNAAMNSFSHYAFGAVMEWGFRDLAGIDLARAGYRSLILRPSPPSLKSNPDGKPLTWVRAEYRSPTGLIRSAWKREGKTFSYDVTVPPNVLAEVQLPATDLASVKESGRAIGEAEGIRLIREENGRVVLGIGSGMYKFTSTIAD